VFVDGDSCPAPVRDVLERSADNRGVTVTFFANRVLPAVRPNRMVIVEGGEVDDEIVAGIREADADETILVVTRDIPLAERVLKSGAAAINDRGEAFNLSTIAHRRSIRDASAEIRAAGLETMSTRSNYGKRELKAFADTLDRVLTRHGF
jgi:hypothetical protein